MNPSLISKDVPHPKPPEPPLKCKPSCDHQCIKCIKSFGLDHGEAWDYMMEAYAAKMSCFLSSLLLKE